MTNLDRDDVKKIKKYIEDDNYSKLKKYITRNDISLNEIITKKGEKMLHLAAKEGSSYCMEYLLDSGALAHLVDKHGNLPLHRALKYVIQNYSRENEKNLVNSLLTFSSKHLDVENVDGVKPRDLILQLERVKARRDESYVSPLDSRGSARVVDKAAAAEEEWRDKLSGECEDEYEHSVGKFEKFTTFSEPSSETYDDWTERIYREFSSKRNKHRNLKQETSSSKKKSKDNKLKPDVDLSEAKRSYDLLKEQKRIRKQTVLCNKLFNTSERIVFEDMPFRDMKAAEILDIVLAECKDDASTIKKRIREELLKWHPDKFKQKLGERIASEQVEDVMAHVKHVSQIIINYGK